MSHTFRRLSLLALLALLAAFAPMARPARAAIRQVTTTADSGAGSLRQAMLDAVSGDTITFGNGATPWTILPLSPLPTLDDGNVTIDGGASHNVVIDGSLAGVSHGFLITSANNTIKGLVINRFSRSGPPEDSGGAGIYMTGTTATNNLVTNCYIGTDSSGSTSAKNTDWGILIDSGASLNTIQGNTISGNGADFGDANIAIHQVKSGVSLPIHDNKVIGNYIGTNAGGTAAIGGGNAGDGILLGSWAQNNTIGGTTASDRNVIGGHTSTLSSSSSNGIYIAAQTSRPNMTNAVLGNYIGVGANGTTQIANGNGVQIFGSTNSVIGSVGAGRNIIAGNNAAGVVIGSSGTSGTTVAGNWIGLDASGNPRGNTTIGVQIKTNATTTMVGPGNVISANFVDGVQISTGSGTANNHTVKGNYISTDSTGSSTSSTLRNGQVSVRVGPLAAQNTIEGNVIALGGAGVGINLTTSSATGNIVQANYIGVNGTGLAALTTTPASGSSGILLDGGAANNMIGGPTAAARNIISGNYHGIQIKDSGTDGNTIQNNYIGTDINGTGAIGNKGNGIRVLTGPTSAFILNNLIANNASSLTIPPGAFDGGIYVSGASGIKISQTATRNNLGNGINLVSGANGGIQPPTNLVVTGSTLTGNAPGCGGCTIEVFTSPTQDNGEGPRYIPGASGTAGGSGNFTIDAAGCDQFLTATATNAGGNTSIFANPMVGNCAVSQANVQLDQATPNAQTVAPGVTATYQHTLHNSGTAAGNFTITNSAPPAGWTVVVNPTSTSLAAGATTTINVNVTPPANALAGAQAVTTITASVGSSTDSKTDTTTVQQIHGVTISAMSTSGTVTPPGSIDYSLQITNTGNGSDTISLSETHTNPGVTVSFPDGNQCAGLAAGASCTLHVRVNVAAGATGADTTTVTATTQGPGAATSNPPAALTTTIITAAVPAITDATPNPQNILPGNTATFIHTVTNVGNIGGQFTVSLLNSAPPGWTFLYTPTTSFTLAPGATQTVEVTISAKTGANAPDVNTSATAQVQVMSSDNALDTTNDTATALLRPAFTFSAATQPTVNNAVPGRTAVFTHTLTNDGNGTDTFNITVTPPGGWTADPIGPITLARNASQQVVVRVHVPNGQGAGSYQFDVTAQTAGTPQPAAQTRQDTVVVVGAAVPQLSPAQTKNATPPLPATVSFTHILTNTGNQAGTFSLSAAVQGAPAGWSAAPSQPSCSLVQNASCTFTVNVTVPAGALVGDQAILVTASIAGPPPASDSVLDIVKVPAIPGLTFTPSSLSNTGDPGAQVTYVHTLTNTGNGDDTYTVTLQVSPGWTATANPLVVSVPRNQSRPVTVTVTVPTGVLAGSTGTVTATATSRLAPYPSASVVDQTTINAKPGAELIPDAQTLGANPTDTDPDTVIFKHTLRNSGSVALTYVLTKTDTLAWTSILTPTEVGPLQPGQTVTVTLSVTAPAGTPIGSPPNVTTIQVRDKASPASPPLETATDTTIVGPKYGVLITPVDNYGLVLPGATKVYTHTLTNIGAGPDTFTFGTIDFHGWSVFVAPASVDLAKDASTVISVTVQVPTNILSDTLDLATVTVYSESGNTPIGNAYEHTLVGQVVGADFSPNSSRAIAPGTTVQFIHTLVNTGNGLDTFVFSTTATLNWPVTVTPPSVTLAANETFPSVTVQVQVPANAAPDDLDEITIKAISQSDPTVAPSVRDLMRNPPQPEGLEHNLYLPLIRR